jgi:hypothetical protein
MMSGRDLPEVPPKLVEAAVGGHLVVLVGSGASKGAGLPEWKALLADLLALAKAEAATQAQRDELAEVTAVWGAFDSPLLQASAIGQAMGTDWVNDAIARSFHQAAVSPTSTDRALAALPGAAFLTTNYDQLLEAALEERTGRPPRRVLLTDLEGIRDFRAGEVLKLHGDLDAPASIVLQAEDYYRVGHEAPRAWKERLKALLQPPYRLLLVGYSYGDADVQEVVDELRGAYGGLVRGPFWLTVKGTVSKVKARALALEMIGLDGYGNVVPWLEALAAAIEAEKRRMPLAVKAAAYADLAREELRARSKRAGELFEAQHYEEARVAFQDLLDTAERLARADLEDRELRRWIARSRLNVAGCALCLQAPEARDLFVKAAEHGVDELRDEGRAQLAMGLTQLGELERARSVLPADDTSDDVKAARQLAELKEGQLPDKPWASSPILRMHLAGELVERGYLAEGARMARELLGEEAGDALVVFYCLVTLEVALRKSVFDQEPLVETIPLGDRWPSVEAIERHIDGSPSLPDVLAQDLRRLRVSFYDLTLDQDRLALALDALGEDLSSAKESRPPHDRVLDQAEVLAREGKLDEAFALIDPSAHPWRPRFDRAQLLALARRFDEAIAEATDLARTWPGRAPIEHLLAELLLNGAHPEEALPHAQAGFEALPGRGYRLLLGQCLLAGGKAEAAWEVLAPLAGSKSEVFLRTRALAAEQVPGHVKEAPACWEAYLDVYPDADAARVRIAQLRFQAGDPEGAAAAARKAIDDGEGKLDAQSLYACAQLVRAGGQFDERAKSYVHKVAEALHKRFPGDREAEQYRFVLLGALGFPEGAPPVDYEALVAAGMLVPLPMEQMAAAMRDRHVLHQQAYEAYRQGHLPFESLCELTQTAAATHLVSFLHFAATDRLTALSAPVELGEGIHVPGLRGRRILAGEIELLLLEHFGLWRRLREELGDAGKLVVFEGVRERLTVAAGSLAAEVQRVALERQERLLHLLTSSPGKIRLDEGEQRGTDESWAGARGVPLVVDAEEEATWTSTISTRRLIQHLGEKGHVEAEVAERLVAALPADKSPAKPLDELPERIALSYAPLQRLFDTGLLEALLRIDGLQIEVGPATMGTVRWRHDALRREAEAADLASGVHRAVGAGHRDGWVLLIPRPRVVGLPDVREQANADWMREVRREPLERGLSFRQALLDDPDLLLLAADFFVASEIDPFHGAALAWPSRADVEAFVTRMRPPHDREIHIPALLRLLGRDDPAATRTKLRDLATLGFVEALGPEDLLKLAGTYRGLDGQEPKRLLDRVEWMVREQGHLGANMAFLRLGDVYAKAIWEAFCGKERLSDELARALAISLLNRAEGIGENWAGSLVDLVIQFAVGKLVSDAKLSFEEPKPGQTEVRLSLDSPGGKLWSGFVGWAGLEGNRRAAYGRAVRRLWLQADKLAGPRGPTRLQASGLLLTLRVDSLSTIHPEIAAPAILSANWKERVLADIHSAGRKEASLESTFQRGALLLASASPEAVSVGEHLMFLDALRDERGNPVVMPPEAVLLRMATEPPDAFADFARHLARLQGQHDGRAYAHLHALATNPDDADRRRAYARMAVDAPWRVVRDEPSTVRAWGWHARHMLGHTVTGMDLPTLREILSEPAAPLDEGKPLGAQLAARISDPTLWAQREDQFPLCLQASQVPGILPAFCVHARLRADKPTFTEDVAAALRRLDAPNDQPAARLAADIFFLRVAALRRPFAALPEGEIDLRERLPERLVAVLRAVTSAPPPDTLADLEAGLLRLCGDVVQELAFPAGLPLKDWLWLTYRLYQWLCAQLDAITPDARRAGLSALRKVSPGPRDLAPQADDLLNPFRFDGKRFDHRLATVLYALGFMEELPSHIAATEQDEKQAPRAVTSTALEEILIALAARPLTADERALRARGDKPSCLDWSGPSAIPDLALHALLQLNSGAIFALPEEARLRWILEIPRGPEDKTLLGEPLANRLLAALTEHAPQLSAAEKSALEARLRDMQDTTGAEWQWIGFTQLYGAGCLHLEREVQDLLLQHLAAPNAPSIFGVYLVALSRVAPDRLKPEAERILAEVEARRAAPGTPPDPVAFAWGLGAVIVAGDPASIPVAKDLLRGLAQREPYRDHDEMRRLLGLLGLT